MSVELTTRGPSKLGWQRWILPLNHQRGLGHHCGIRIYKPHKNTALAVTSHCEIERVFSGKRREIRDGRNNIGMRPPTHMIWIPQARLQAEMHEAERNIESTCLNANTHSATIFRSETSISLDMVIVSRTPKGWCTSLRPSEAMVRTLKVKSCAALYA